MSTPCRFCYQFHPVGQGLFASGAIYNERDPEPSFQWVYDCGTSSSPALINDAIGRLYDRSETRKRLDLVAISHFDHDHISGLCQLISKFEVGTLLLPYMPLEQRLRQAFEEGLTPTDEVMGFFINPVNYLRLLRDDGLQNVLFVRPSGRQGPPFQGESQDVPDFDESGDITFTAEEPTEDVWDNLPSESTLKRSVEFLKRDGAIRVGGVWEFVPYNIEPEEVISEGFRQAVIEKRDQLLSAGDRNQALRELKGLYDDEFGDSSQERNIISLFLYAGPIYSAWPITVLHCCKPNLCFRHIFWNDEVCGYNFCNAKEYHEKCSILYSGDGYLDTPERLTELSNFLMQQRMDRIGVFQVMHHGAQKNWHEGVASTINPRFSIFSSNPERKGWGHPHAAVLRDFWRYGPVQVDKIQGAEFDGWIGHK